MKRRQRIAEGVLIGLMTNIIWLVVTLPIIA